jgi:hypothetical protein
MKKLIYGIFVVSFSLLFLGCPNVINTIIPNRLSPPSWIIGTWSTATIPSAPSLTITCQFTSSNFIYSGSGMSINYVEAFGTSLHDTSSSTLYEVSCSQNGTNQKSSFSKLTATTLNYSVTVSGVTVGPLKMTKQ